MPMWSARPMPTLFPMVNAYQSTYSGGQDAFIAELNPSGTAILNSTYFGSGTYASGMALDSQGNVYVAGPEFDSIPTVDPASTSGDLYVAEINLTTSTLVYSTTLGATDSGAIITPVGVTSNGNIILAGDTTSDSFPTQNAYQSSLTGFRNAFVTGLQPELTVSYYAGTTATGTPLSGAPSEAGTYTVVATFTSTDPNYASAQSDPVTFTISPSGPVNPTVTAFDTSGNYDGSPFAATATALGTDGEPVSGTFAFTYYVGTSTTGTGTSSPPVDAGTYTVEAAFTSADPDYSDAQTHPVTFTISPAATATAVAASTATPVYGQSETLTATITSAGGTPTTGTVTFFDGATPLTTVGINNGTASFTTTAPDGRTTCPDGHLQRRRTRFFRERSVLSPASIIQTVAGTGVAGYNGDGIPATSAELYNPYGVAVDSKGDLFIADAQNNLVLEVNATTHLITTVAGTGVAGYNGDGIAATSAELDTPIGVAVDSQGDLFIADDGNSRVREVSAATGLISTIAGTGGYGYNGDGIAATSAELYFPVAVAVDSAGNVYISDFENQRVREVSAATGLISTIAGTGTAGYNGDGIAATSAELNFPTGLAVDAAGDVFIADAHNNSVREVNAVTGLISTVAGTGTGGYNGDGIAATSGQLNSPEGLAVDSAGNLFIVDNANQRSPRSQCRDGPHLDRRGAGFFGYNGDGIAAGSATLNFPVGVALGFRRRSLHRRHGEQSRSRDRQRHHQRHCGSGHANRDGQRRGGRFNGGPFAATATVAGVDNTPGSSLEGGPLTLTYYAGPTATGTPLSGAPSNAGTYTVVASFPGSNDYATATDSTTFVISPATPTVTAIDADGLFNGSPFAATGSAVRIGGAAVSGNFTFTYYVGNGANGTGSSTPPTHPGTYTVFASFTSSDPNYTGTSSGPTFFVIFQAAPVFTVSDAGGTFNGSPFPAQGTVAGVVAGVDNTPGSSLEGVEFDVALFRG